METIGNYSNRTIYKANFMENRIYMNRPKVEQWIEELFTWLFCQDELYISYTLFSNKEVELKDSLKGFLLLEKYPLTEAVVLTTLFFERIGTVHQLLLEDMNAIIRFDPAAKSKNEVLIAYPGFYALAVHRLSHELWQYGLQILPRLISEHSHSRTGIDIHPAAVIGKRFHIDHGTSIVIGETAKIGNDVKIFQGVTLGALSVDREMVSKKRHPTIEDHVILYANATILGGTTVIGERSVIGGNVWLTDSVPPNTQVFHKSDVVIRQRKKQVVAAQFNI